MIYSLRDDTPAALPEGSPHQVILPSDLGGPRQAFEAGRNAAKALQLEKGYALFQGCFDEDATALQRVQDALGYGSVDQELIGLGLYEKLERRVDAGLLFIAGFALEGSRRFSVVLQGGLEMAAVLLVIDKIAGRDALAMDPRRMVLHTTPELAMTYNLLWQETLAMIDFTPKAVYGNGKD